ncbi:hypothetical protein [Streptomyces sp. Da 82-17]
MPVTPPISAPAERPTVPHQGLFREAQYADGQPYARDTDDEPEDD